MRNRVLLVFAAGLIVIGGVMLLRGPKEPIESIDWYSIGTLDWDTEPTTKVSFYNQDREIIVIDIETGNVTLAKGLELDEASREFWKILRLHFVPCPSLEKEEQP